MHTISIKGLPDRSRTLLRPNRADYGRRITVVIASLWRLLLVWQQRSNERHALARLDRHRLEDLGLTPQDVAREVAKPFWRA